jgi:hypothetical protein
MVRDLSQGPGLTAAIWGLACTAARVLDTHVSTHGQCAVCQTRFPCPVACLAETNLSALTQPPSGPQPAARGGTPLQVRAPAPPPGAARSVAAGTGTGLPILRRVLAALRRLGPEPPAGHSPAARTGGLHAGIRSGAAGTCS